MRWAAVAGVLGWLCAPLPARACRCVEPSGARAYRRASLVVVAEVVQVTPRPDIHGWEARVHVIDAWKQDTPETFTVVTGGGCAYAMNAGERHLIFVPAAQGTRAAATTGKCMGNAPVERAARSLAWLRRHGKRGAVTRAPP